MNKDKRTYKERSLYKIQQEKKSVENLEDRYIIKCIKRHSDLKSKEIRECNKLIELYRANLLLKRAIKNELQKRS